MAKLRAFAPIQMQSYTVSEGTVTFASGELVRELRSFEIAGEIRPAELVYSGVFSLAPRTGTPDGVVNAVSATADGAPWVTLSGTAQDLQETRALLDGGDLSNVLRTVLAGGDVIEGSDGDDVLDGLGGDDRVEGGAGDDVLWGFTGDDTLLGGAGDDRLEGEAGSDLLDGGPGRDVATYFFVSQDYSVVLSPTSIAVHHVADPAGSIDTLVNVEDIYFAGANTPAMDDVALDLLKLGGARTLSEQQVTDLVEMYVAYFDRAPDAIGLHFWGTALATGSTMEDIATLFFRQPETQAAFPDPEDSANLVDTAYRNVLERAPDAEGREWWIDALDSGAVTRAEFMLELLDGARANPDALDDVRTIEQKGDIGLYYAAVHGLTDAGNARLVMKAYDRENAADSLEAARALIDAFAAEAFDPDGGGEFTMPLVGVVDDPFSGL
jgi:hypothetical protein